MRLFVHGAVVEKDTRTYPKADGTTGQGHRLFVRRPGSSEAYGPDRVDVTPEVYAAVERGEVVTIECVVNAKLSVAGNPWLSVYGVELAAAPFALATV